MISASTETVKRSGVFRSFDDTPIYYEVRGQGRPLILCYGIVCTMNHWHPQIRRFSSKYTVITMDYRGHHKSETPKDRNNLSIDGIAQDIFSLCEHLGVQCASLWGHSFGAQVLLRTYDMYPKLFDNIVLINGFASDPITGMFGLGSMSSIFKVMCAAHQSMPETLSHIWKKSAKNPLAMRLSALAGGFNLSLTSFKDIEIYGNGVANIDIEVFIHLFDQMVRYDGRSVLDRVDVPTLIIGGSMDRVTPPRLQRELHERIRTSEWISVPYGTHCTQLDMPELVNMHIERFLGATYNNSPRHTMA